MSSPSMVTRTGDSLVVRSVVSGNQLYVDNKKITTNKVVQDDPGDENVEYSNVEDLPQCKVKRNYACNICNEYFTQNPRHYLYHLRDVHREKVKIYECTDCLYASRHCQKLVRHMRIVHGKDESSVHCVEDATNTQNAGGVSTRPKRKRRRVQRIYETEDDIVDEERDLSPATSPVLVDEDVVSCAATKEDDNNQNHHQVNTKASSGTAAGDHLLKCSLCEFTTRHQGQLTRHERQDHIKTKFFRCVKCSYVTHIKARFTKHVKYHSMPMIKCDLCDFRTPYKWNLDRHYKNHNGKGAFKCSACNFTADIKQSLTVHEMNHHVPPVGQAASAGLGVGRRRNKVGGSDLQHNADLDKHPEDDSAPPQNNNSGNKQQKPEMLFTLQSELMDNNNSIVDAKTLTKNYISVKSNNNNEFSLRNKKRPTRPIPNLIPIQGSPPLHQQLKSPITKYDQAFLSPIDGERSQLSETMTQQDIKDLCAKTVNSALRDFTSLFDIDTSQQTDDLNDMVEITPIKQSPVEKLIKQNQTAVLGKKNASFFDRLKEKLMTGTENCSSLACNGCGYISKCLSEFASHQKTCGKYIFSAGNVSDNFPSMFSSSRCQHCRQRCKSSADLFLHLQSCSKKAPSSNLEECSDTASTDDRASLEITVEDTNRNAQAPHPMENVVFVWNNIPQVPDDDAVVFSRANLDEDDVMLDLSVRSTHTESPICSENSLLDNNDQNSSSQNMQISLIPQPRPASSNENKPPTHGNDIDTASVPGGKKVFKCPHCSFWATTASRFHVHIVGHLNKKPFECSLCSYRSNWRWDITKHIRLKSVRDSAHQRAKVLMTDETGRRNYSKYNKYLTQMRDSNSGTPTSEKNGGTGRGGRGSVMKVTESCGDETQGDNDAEDATLRQLTRGQNASKISDMQSMIQQFNNDVCKLTSMLNGQQMYSPKFAGVTIHGSGEENGGKSRPMPALKAADSVYTSSSFNAVTSQTSASLAELKKTLWKCKKCNFRDGDREILLRHVKEHYVQQDSIKDGGGGGGWTLRRDQVTTSAVGGTPNPVTTDEASVSNVRGSSNGGGTSSAAGHAPFRCGHCHQVSNWKHVIQRHCRLKHQGDVRVLVGGANNSEKMEIDDQSDDCIIVTPSTEGRCGQCPFETSSQTEMAAHADKHTLRSDSLYRCYFCPYYVTQKHDLTDHLTVHGASDIDQYPPAQIGKEVNGNDTGPLKRYHCIACPYVSNSKSQFLYHKQFHRPRNAPFKCTVCSYNVSRRHLLHQHLRVHGIHLSPNSKSKGGDFSPSREIDENETDMPMELNLETQHFIDIPLVWATNNGKFSKMFKCRFCPHVNVRRNNIDDHEKMHFLNDIDPDNRCEECTFASNNAVVLQSHSKVHLNDYYHVHCLVDPQKTDEEQITELSRLLNIASGDNTDTSDEIPDVSSEFELGFVNEPDAELVNDSTENPGERRVLHFCDNCPARFLFEKEFNIHMKFHNIKLAFKCHSCTYSARQNSHLLSHLKVHTEEYQEKTKLLQTMYTTSSGHAQPLTAVIMDVPGVGEPVWVVVSEGPNASMPTETPDENDFENVITASRVPNKHYSCDICPARFFKALALQYHISLHGSDGPYKCKRCDYAVKTIGNLTKHETMHDENENSQYVDSELKKSVATKVKTCSNSVPISGTDLFDRRSEAQKNETSSEKIVIRPVEHFPPPTLHVDPQFGILMHGNPEFIYPTYMKNGRMKEKRYKCHKCPSAFEKREQYKVHLSLHGSKQRYRCDNCDYSVKYYANYVQHVRKHQMNADAQEARRKSIQSTDEETGTEDNQQTEQTYAIKSIATPMKGGPLKLSVADRQSLMILQQRRLNNINGQKDYGSDDTNRKMYWCSHCPYTNYRKDAVDNHIRKHIAVSGFESNYTCAHCDYSVPQSHFLRDHIKLHFLPMKNNKLEAYMICDKMELLINEIDEGGDKVEKQLFKDEGSENKADGDRFRPVLTDAECLIKTDENKVFINCETGEFREDCNIIKKSDENTEKADCEKISDTELTNGEPEV